MNVSESANRVVDLSRKIHDYYEAELPKRFPNYPLVELEDLEKEEELSPPEEKELRNFLATLPEETLHQLLLIMHLGRGEFGTEDLAENYARLKRLVGDAEQTAFHMMVFDATLADELSDGLEELRKHKISADKLPLKRSKVRKG